MDIREFTTYNPKSPFTGYGLWIVLQEGGGKAHLLHPVHLCELIVSEYEFKTSSGLSVWPLNCTGTTFHAARFVDSFKKRIKFFLENERSFPTQTVAKALAFFEDISHEEALAFIGKSAINEYGESISPVANKTTREYALAESVDLSRFKGRKLVILSAFKEYGPASIYSITSLVEGTLNTVTDKCRVVTYFVNKFAAEGILQIVA